MSVTAGATRIISKSLNGYRMKQVDNIITPYDITFYKHPPIAPEIIKFRIRVRNLIQRPRYDHGDNDGDDVVVDGSHQVAETITAAAFFRGEENAHRLLAYRLSPMGVPESWQRKILSPAVFRYTHTLLVDPRNAGRQWLGILVEVDMWTIEQTLSRFYINDLNKKAGFYIEDDEDEDYLNKKKISEDCAICLEKLSVDKDFVNLPCSHVYHWHCIIHSIFRSSVLCPLCRGRLVDPWVQIPRRTR